MGRSTFFVVQSEGFFQFLLHRLGILFHQETGGQCAKLSEFNLPGTIVVDLGNDVGQHFIVQLMPQHAQNRADHGGLDETFFLLIECIEGILEHCFSAVYWAQDMSPIDREREEREGEKIWNINGRNPREYINGMWDDGWMCFFVTYICINYVQFYTK